MRIKLKRTTKQYITVALLCITVIGGAGILTTILMTQQVKQEYQSLLDEAYNEMNMNKRIVYLAKADIAAGDYIKKDALVKKKVYATQPQNTYFTAKDFDKIAIVPISEGTQVLKSMVTDHTISSELRELEFNVIHVNSNIIDRDTVDVRIFYPNGESFVVLSKKVLKGYILETATCYFWLNEEELFRMSAAIVDAGLYPGSKLYVTKYIEPNIQDPSEVTYIPNISILNRIENDPNIVERCSQTLYKDLRKALENRLANSLAMDISTIQWEINSDKVFVPSPTPKSTESISTNSISTNSKPTESISTDSDSKPTNSKPKDTKPTDTKPTNSLPVDSRPTDNRSTRSSNQKPDQMEEVELGKTDQYLYYAEVNRIGDDIEYGK